MIVTIILGCSMIWLSKGNEFAEIEQIKPTTIFQPFGKVVNQFTYANIRVHIDITSLFDEVEKLCYASKLLKEGKKTMTTSGSSRKLVHMLTEDLIQVCNTSTRKLEAMTKTFGFQTLNVPDYTSAFNRSNITKLWCLFGGEEEGLRSSISQKVKLETKKKISATFVACSSS